MKRLASDEILAQVSSLSKSETLQSFYSRSSTQCSNVITHSMEHNLKEITRLSHLLEGSKNPKNKLPRSLQHIILMQ
jgi:hypothetical protein